MRTTIRGVLSSGLADNMIIVCAKVEQRKQLVITIITFFHAKNVFLACGKRAYKYNVVEGKGMELKELETELGNFSGSEKFFRHWMQKGVYTEGVKHMCEVVGAYWLIDVIFSYHNEERVKSCEFQIWRIEVKDNKAIVDMREDSDREAVIRQEIEYTDFPAGVFELYYCNDTLLLKSEY